jgi:predicted metal-binding membrane protein
MSAAMMAAMMFPSALPAALRCDRLRPALGLVASYLAVWAAVGAAIYAVVPMSGAVTIAAGVYELTPFKRACRRRCRERVRSGFELGLYCLGSSFGLMAALVALGAMSVVWMAVFAAVVLAQKLLPPAAVTDVPLALVLVALGALAV